MANSETIDTSQNPDNITFKVLIEGQELSKVYQVTNIVVSREVNRIPFAQLVIGDGDPSERDFALSNTDLLIPGKKIEIRVGYHSDEESIFKGIIIKHSLKVRSGSSHLIIECKDQAVKMTIGRKSSYYYDSKDSDIFSTLIGKYSDLTADLEDTVYQHKELVQYNSSDWDFLVSRAQANGKLCIVKDGTVKIKKPDLSQSELQTVVFGATILDFDAEIDARDQFKKVTAYSWNPADQVMDNSEAADPSVSLNSNLTATTLAGITSPDDYELRHGGNLNGTVLQSWADATMLYQQLAKVRGRVRFQGIPTVLPGTIIKLEGVGDRFNGKIYVTAIRHTIANGDWTIDVQFGMNPEWFSETYEIHTPVASGLLPAIRGLHVGVVTQLESDPEGEDRIQVKIPVVNGTERGIWCRVSSLDAGNKRGAFFRPEIEDEVIVGFINEDPSQAVVLGMLNSSAKPAPITASDDNHEKGFVTRSEMKVLFNDEKKSIVIETPAGKSVSLDEDAGTIILKDEHSNSIKMDSSGIVIESAGEISIKAKKDVKIEGVNVDIKASAKLKADGGAGADFTSSSLTVLKGSVVQIN